MITRLSNYLFKTLREDPADAEVQSHKLLVRAGYIRRQAPGVFAWLPLGLRVKERIEAIVREEMTAAGAYEVHFPALLPREAYEASGRWEEYGDALFRLRDRHGADYLLAPTHEEVFTLLVKDLISSYKDLPLTIFQIQDKYRDEARPRAGLLRGREFTMKDAYSFDTSDAGLDASYQKQRDAYEKIFTRLGLDYVIVKADAGAMGGSRSEEFLLPIEVGEDTFVRSAGGYAANIEAYVTPAVPDGVQQQALARFLQDQDLARPTLLATPDASKISSLLTALNSSVPRPAGEKWQASHTLKNVVLALVSPEGNREIVVVGLPGDREVDMKRAEVAFKGFEVTPASAEDFARHRGLVAGYIGPCTITVDGQADSSGAANAVADGVAGVGVAGPFLGESARSGVRYLLDPRVSKGTVWVSGANREGVHALNLVCGRDFFADGTVDVASVRDGDPAPDGSGPIETARGMEIGHVFQLGRKYAETLGLKVLDEHGKQVTVTMGSYGIGVTRILAALAELNHDERGLTWPSALAPYDAHIVATGKESFVFEQAEKIAEEAARAGFEVLFDDRRKVSPGVKFGDAELLGVPRIVVVGRDAQAGLCEVWDRVSGARENVPFADVVVRLQHIR